MLPGTANQLSFKVFGIEAYPNPSRVTEEAEKGSVPHKNSDAEETPSLSGSEVGLRSGVLIPEVFARLAK